MLGRVLLLLLACLTLCVWLLHAGLAITFPYQLEYGEGAVLGFSTLLARGEAIYRNIDLPPCVSCIYAPLHLWLAGPTLAGGRLLAVLATLGTLATLLVYMRVRLGSVAAVASGLCFLLHPLVFNWCVLDRIDMLALLFTTLGLCLAERRRSLPAALCLAAAFFAKQSYLAGAAAAALAACWDRRWRSAALIAAALALPFVALNLATHGEAYRQLFGYNAAFAGRFQGDLLALWLRSYLPSELPLLVLAALTLRPREKTWFLFTLLAALMGLGSGRPAGYYNYFLELHLALCVAAGLALARPEGWVRVLVVAQLLAGGTAELKPTMFSPAQFAWYETRKLAQGRYPGYLDWDAGSLAPWLARYPGPVLAENMGNPLALGVFPWYCDVVTFRCLAEAGVWDERSLLQRIERGEFALILLQVEQGNLRFTPRAIAAIQQRYRKVGQAGVDSIYRPK